MAYDRRDDGVFEVAEAINTLAEAMGERTLPHQMVLEETRRIARIAQSASIDDETLKPAAQILGRIHSDFADGRQDAEGVTLDLRDVLRNVREQYSTRIEYEGLDASHLDEKMRRDHHLPGERVSIAVRQDGTPAIDPSAGLGDEPLTVSGLFVRGELMNMGGEKPAKMIIAEYEFEGHEGRHRAERFHAENGQGNAYGVVLKRDERVFLTPLTEIGDVDNPWYAPTGVSREIVGGAGRSEFHHVHPEGFRGLSEQLTPAPGTSREPDSDKGPMIGEFNYDTATRGDEVGPIRLAGIGWSSSPNHRQLETAERQVDEFIRSERHAAMKEEIQTASDAYRKGRPDSGHGAEDFTAPREHAEVAAFNEARHLLRDREPSPLLNGIVAEIATSNRRLREGGDLSGDRDMLQTALDMQFGTSGVAARDKADDRSMIGQIAKVIEGAPKGVSEVENPMFTHAVGKGSISDPETAGRLDEIATASTDSIRVAVADTPTIGLGTHRGADGTIEWSAIDASTGVLVRDGEQKDAASILSAMLAVQRTMESFGPRRGIMAQAGAVESTPTPSVAKGGNDPSAVAVMSAALDKGARGR